MSNVALILIDQILPWATYRYQHVFIVFICETNGMVDLVLKDVIMVGVQWPSIVAHVVLAANHLL